MLCQDGTHADVKAPTKRQQRKFDGTRTAVIKDFDDVSLIGSRKWVNDYGRNHPELVEAVRKLPVDRCILDAEFTFFKKGTDRDVPLTAGIQTNTLPLPMELVASAMEWNTTMEESVYRNA